METGRQRVDRAFWARCVAIEGSNALSGIAIAHVVRRPLTDQAPIPLSNGITLSGLARRATASCCPFSPSTQLPMGPGAEPLLKCKRPHRYRFDGTIDDERSVATVAIAITCPGLLDLAG